MNPFVVSIIVAAVLIVAGLGTCALSGYAKVPLLVTVGWVAGVVMLVIGLLLLLFPPLAWLYHTLLSMFGLSG